MRIPDSRTGLDVDNTCGREKHLSAVIDVLRFPLISLVVLYHAFNCSVSLPPGAYDWHQPVTDFIYWKLLHDAIARSAVPLFFFLSGYLYFHHAEISWKSWCHKTWNRFFRLWIPLWSWSCLTLIFFGLLYSFGSSSERAQYILGTAHSVVWWMDGFLGLKTVSGPHFFSAGWFVRDLFFAGLLSPLWNVLLRPKPLAVATLFFLYLLYLTIFAPLPFLGSRAMFFFCFGAAYSIHRRDFAIDAEKAAIPCGILWCSGAIAGFFIHVPYLSALTTTFLIPVLVALVSWGCRRNWVHPVSWLASSSFFVYFCHDSPCFRVPWDLLRTHLFIPYGDLPCLGSILLNWLAGTFLPVGIFVFLRRFFPVSLFFLCGIAKNRRK